MTIYRNYTRTERRYNKYSDLKWPDSWSPGLQLVGIAGGGTERTEESLSTVDQVEAGVGERVQGQVAAGQGRGGGQQLRSLFRPAVVHPTSGRGVVTLLLGRQLLGRPNFAEASILQIKVVFLAEVKTWKDNDVGMVSEPINASKTLSHFKQHLLPTNCFWIRIQNLCFVDPDPNR